MMFVGTYYINISKTKNRQQHHHHHHHPIWERLMILVRICLIQRGFHPRLHFVLHFVIHLHTYSNQDRKYHPLHHHHYNQLHPLDQVQVKRVDVSVQGTLLKCTLKIVGHCLKIYLHQEFKHICWWWSKYKCLQINYIFLMFLLIKVIGYNSFFHYPLFIKG